MFGFYGLKERVENIENKLKEAERVRESVELDKECAEETKRIGKIKEPYYSEYYGHDSYYSYKLGSCSKCVVNELAVKCIISDAKGRTVLVNSAFIGYKPKQK